VFSSEQSSQLEEKTFVDGACTLNYAEGPPNGPPLLFIHGLGRNWQDFLSLIPDFSKKWHIYAVDLRGHGKSGRVLRGYTTSGYAADVVAFLQQLVGQPAIVFGHSLGGVVGVRVAAEHSGSVRALILGDCLLSRESLRHSLYATLFAGLHRVASQRGSLQETAARLSEIKIPVPHVEEPIALGDFPGNDDAYFRRWADCLLQIDPDVFAMTLDGSSLADFDGYSLLARVECPTLILQASPDLGGLMPDKEVAEAMRLLRRGSLVRFPLLGHALHLQKPQPVSDAVLTFLRSLSHS
jgi:pimeloyl-ACP methyl ester carboxylesterase